MFSCYRYPGVFTGRFGFRSEGVHRISFDLIFPLNIGGISSIIVEKSENSGREHKKKQNPDRAL